MKIVRSTAELKNGRYCIYLPFAEDPVLPNYCSVGEKHLQGLKRKCETLNSLIGVVIRFRKEPVAVMSGIHAMIHQVQVPDKHVNFLRFLWWPNGNTDQEPVEHRMRVHLFGAVSCANYALRRTAEDNVSDFPDEVISTVRHNFYVDNCQQIAKDLTAL